MVIDTERLRLRSWQEGDRASLAALYADPEVMRDYGAPFTREASDQRFERYVAAFAQHRYTRWVVESRAGQFLGYTGVMTWAEHPIGAHSEIGWRLARSAWGKGYATEAAHAALQDMFLRIGMQEVLAYTQPDNVRSQAVMARLGLERAAARDFDLSANGRAYRLLVWISRSA